MDLLEKNPPKDVEPEKGGVDARRRPEKGNTNLKGPAKGVEKSYTSRFLAAISGPKEAPSSKQAGSGSKPLQPPATGDVSSSDLSGDEDVLPPPAQAPPKAPAQPEGKGHSQAASRVTRSRSAASSRIPSADEAGGSTNPPPTKEDKVREAARNEALRRYLALDELDELMETSSGSSSEDEGRTAPTKAPPKPPAASAPDAKRGRGRPSTTGEYVGLAAAKQALAEAQRAELALQVEKEIAENAQSMATTRVTRHRVGTPLVGQAPPDARVERANHAEGLQRQIADSLAVVAGVAKVSKGLKGTLQKALKDAVASIQEASEELLARTHSEEVALLRAANSRMETEIADLRSELRSLQAEVTRPRAEAAPPAPPPNLETTMAANLDRLTRLMESRFAAMEERLRPVLTSSPAPRARPTPLSSPSLISGRPAEEFPPLPTQRDSLETAAPLSPRSACPAPPPPAATTAEGWTTVSRKKRAKNRAQPSSGTQPVTTAAESQPTRTRRRGGRRREGKGKGEVAQAPASQPPPPPPPASKKKTVAKEKRPPRLRPPKSAAVVLTLQPGAADRGVTFANLFSKAKSQIRLADLGIEGGLRLRKARTGGRILVLPSANDASKADALADQLKTVLYPEDVRISRPEKTVCLRVSGLDDHAHEEDVVAAIARTTGCSQGSIKASKVRPGKDGMGQTVVACPVAAAKQLLAAKSKLLVGWASATVEALPHRPQRCYRCHEVGHVAAVCPSEVDRSGNCFRCGKDGHLVTGPCSAKPHCPLCEAAGRSASHQLGSKPCGAKKPTRRKVQASRMAPGETAAAADTPAAAGSDSGDARG